MIMTTAAPTATESVSLYYRQGSSDKVYQASIDAAGQGYMVRFAYGRRGSTLTTGAKTASPVDFETAKKTFDKLVAEKRAKGYTPDTAGTPYQHDVERVATQILPQLANPTASTNHLLADPGWFLQEKFDGQRVMIRRIGDTITGINRTGCVIALPVPVVTVARTLRSQDWLLDGEAMGDAFIAFDLIESASIDLRGSPLRDRLSALESLVPADGVIRFAPTARSAPKKRALATQLEKARREGLVFKRADSLYSPGRPASGGDWLKFKFVATASCVVAAVNVGRRSVALQLLNGGEIIGVGNVTVPPNHSVPEPGRVVEIRYLYAYPGGSLYQPVYLGERNDIDRSACTLDQLKYKSSDDA